MAGSARTTLVALVASGAVLLGSVGTVALRRSPHRSTRFATGYDENLFRSIAIGDSVVEVRMRLGEPLEHARGSELEYLSYSQPLGSPSHMVHRRFAVDPNTGRVVRIDDSVAFDYLAPWTSSGGGGTRR